MTSPQESSTFARSPDLLRREESRLLIVDMQEKLLRVIPEAAAAIASCELLMQGAKTLGIPVSLSEQYPQGLGATVPALAGLADEAAEKLRFSAAGAWEWTLALGSSERPQVVVAGIEAHICVLQTVLDLIAAGFSVSVVEDAVASRSAADCETALRRMRDVGAIVTTAESVLFEWCETAEAPEFKAISRLVKERGPR